MPKDPNFQHQCKNIKTRSSKFSCKKSITVPLQVLQNATFVSQPQRQCTKHYATDARQRDEYKTRRSAAWNKGDIGRNKTSGVSSHRDHPTRLRGYYYMLYILLLLLTCVGVKEWCLAPLHSTVTAAVSTTTSQ
jgi:hypothetical protein